MDVNTHHSVLLSTAELHTTAPDSKLITTRQASKVIDKEASTHNFSIPHRVKGVARAPSDNITN